MDTKKRKDLILNGGLYKVIITLAVPMMISNLIQTLYSIVDGIWVSKIGTSEFAATSFVWPVNFLFISIGMGLSIAGTSLLSQFIGASKYKEASKYASQLVVMSVISALIFSGIGFLLTPIIVTLMGASGELATYSNIFLRITFLDMPFTFLFFAFNAIMNSQGNTLMTTFLSAASVVLNCILDPIFIFTLNMGVGGAAFATLVAKAVLSILGMYLLMKSNVAVKPSLKNFKFDKTIMNNIVKVGLPSAVGQSGAALGFIVLNSFIASYGTVTIAAFGMVNRITSLIMQPAMGVGASLTAIVGQNLGSEKIDRVKEAFIKAMKLTIGFSIIGCIILIWQEDAVIEFFMQSKERGEVFSQGIVYLRMISFSMPLMGMFSVYQGLFQGSGHTKYSMNMEIGRLWFVRLPMILIFKYLTEVGSSGIWFSMSFSNLIVCIYGYLVFRKGNWQTKVIREQLAV